MILFGGIIVCTSAIMMYVDFFSVWHDFSHKLDGNIPLRKIVIIFFATLFACTFLLIRYFFRLKKNVNELEKAQSALRKQRHIKSEQDKLAALGELSGGLAHEINNALVPALGMSEILKKRLKDKEPELATFIDVIYESSLHARKIVQNVLAFARGQDEQNEINNAIDVFSKSIELNEKIVPNNIECVIANIEALKDTPIYVNPTAITQITANLLKNATEAMPDGGTITINFDKDLISSEFAVDYDLVECDHLIVAISDTGSGMSEQVLSQVFEPFYTTKDVDRGTGLGLSTVYGIMKNLGGTVTAESELGKGSTFKLFFPITDPAIFTPITAKAEAA
ncbi:MAG: ATP-binding protein [Pseudomonadota bacterium]